MASRPRPVSPIPPAARPCRRSCGQADAYQLQAAIAAEHARAPTYEDTDSAEILRLYDLLVSVAPSPAAGLGRVLEERRAAFDFPGEATRSWQTR